MLGVGHRKATNQPTNQPDLLENINKLLHIATPLLRQPIPQRIIQCMPKRLTLRRRRREKVVDCFLAFWCDGALLMDDLVGLGGWEGGEEGVRHEEEGGPLGWGEGVGWHSVVVGVGVSWLSR